MCRNSITTRNSQMIRCFTLNFAYPHIRLWSEGYQLFTYPLTFYLFSLLCPHSPPSWQTYLGEAASAQSPVWVSDHVKAVGKGSQDWHMASSPSVILLEGIFWARIDVRTWSIQFSPCCSEKECFFFSSPPQQFLIVVAVTTSADGLDHRKSLKKLKYCRLLKEITITSRWALGQT